MTSDRLLSSILTLAEALLIRALPGLLNLAALIVLGARLRTEEFGVYSTIVATATVVGGFILGPLLYGILPEYSKAARSAEGASRFIGLVISVVLLAFAGSLVFAPIAPAPYGAAVVGAAAFAGMSVLQEILRGQFRIWHYAVVAMVQSAANLTAIALLVGPGCMAMALWLFAISYGLGLLTAYGLLGFPPPKFSGWREIAQASRIGGAYTIGAVVENGLFLGPRYVVILFGGETFLGVLSFCIDISQRLIAFLVNAASFAFLPKAYSAERSTPEGRAEFIRQLREGTIVGAAAALLALVVVVSVQVSGWVPEKLAKMFPPHILVPVAIALTINRLKKIAVDPVAIDANRTGAVLYGFIWAVPISLVLTALVLLFEMEWLVAWVLVFGYLFASVVTFRKVKTLKALEQ